MDSRVVVRSATMTRRRLVAIASSVPIASACTTTTIAASSSSPSSSPSSIASAGDVDDPLLLQLPQRAHGGAAASRTGGQPRHHPQPLSHVPRRRIQIGRAEGGRELHIRPRGGGGKRGARRQLQHTPANGRAAEQLQRGGWVLLDQFQVA